MTLLATALLKIETMSDSKLMEILTDKTIPSYEDWRQWQNPLLKKFATEACKRGLIS